MALLDVPAERTPLFHYVMVVLWITGTIAALSLFSYLTWLLVQASLGVSLVMAAALVGVVFVSYVSAVLLTGTMHFAADNFGKIDTPILGPAFIYTFREHHTDQTKICRKHFLEVNGPHLMLGSPVLATVLLLPLETTWGLVGAWFILGFCATAGATNQIHRWSHDAKRPKWVRFMQRTGLFLSPAQHAVHHRAPHDKGFCITNGWMNTPLDKLRFFHGLAWILAGLGVHQDPDSVMGPMSPEARAQQSAAK